MLPPSIGNRKRQVYEIVRVHVGAARAITSRQIGGMVGIPPRHVRRLIEELIVEDEHGEICATTDEPPGYFWASCIEEAQEYMAVLDHRAQMIYVRRQRVARAIQRLPTGRPTQPVLL